MPPALVSGLPKAVMAESFAFEACMARFGLDWQAALQKQTAWIAERRHAAVASRRTGTASQEASEEAKIR